MPTTAVIILTAVIAVATGYLLNQLPRIRQFKGRNWLILRLLIWITLLPVAYELLTNKQVLSVIKTITEFSIAPLVLLLLIDGWKLLIALSKEAGDALSPQNVRMRVLKDVRTSVAIRLKDSLNQQVVINLLMKQQLNYVKRNHEDKLISLEVPEKKQTDTNLILGSGRSLRQNNKSTQPAPQESIWDTFNCRDVGRKLLILGDPGSGKTTILLKLAELLVEEALQEGQQQIPIIFELSTWKDDEQTIYDWLLEQLQLNYPIVDFKTGTRWLKEGNLLPLLDGLDELGTKRQILCVHKINDFLDKNLYPHLVVCCRRKEYRDGKVCLKALKGAVSIEPLNAKKISQYLCEQLEQPEIWQAIQQQPGLNSLLHPSTDQEIGILQIPLFLTVLSAAYEADTLIASVPDLFNAYIYKRLVLDTCSIEREQSRRDWAYRNLEQEPGEERTRNHIRWLAETLHREKLPWLLIEGLQPRWLVPKSQKWIYRLLVGVIIGLLFGFLLGLLVGLLFSPLFGLMFGLSASLVFTLLGSFLCNPEKDITPVEKFKFSMSYETRQERRKALIFGLVFGLFVALTIGLIYSHTSGLIFGLISGSIYGLTIGLINGLKVNLKVREPNQGILAAIDNIPLVTLLSYPGAVSIYYLPTLTLGTGPSLPVSIVSGLFAAITFGICLGGGIALIQHAVLRILLTHAGKIPWNYARFLDYCVERRLLQRIGGRYRFIHSELRDHFLKVKM